MSKKFLLLSALILTILGKLLFPPGIFTDDMVLHIPHLKKELDVFLYKNDYLLVVDEPQSLLTLYYPLVAQAIEKSSLEFFTALSFLHSFYLFSYLYLLQVLVYKICKKIMASFFLGLLVLFGLHIGGSAIQIVEKEFLPRSIAMMLIVLAGVLLIKNKIISGFLALLFSVLFHPLTTFFGLLYVFGLFIKVKFTQKFFLIITLTFIISSIILISLPRINSTWLTIIRLRNSYAFFDLWSFKACINLGGILLPGLFLYFFKKDGHQNKHIEVFFISSFIIALYIFAIHILFAIIFPTSIIINLQLLRFWIFPSLFSLMLLSIFLSKLANQFQLVILVLLSFLLIYRYSIPISLATEANKEAQIWMKDNTSTNCIFLTPFNGRGFRVLSERTILGEYKDGALSFYSESFAYEWFGRFNVLKDWQGKNDEEIKKLQRIYEFNYIVDSSESIRSFPISYSNSEYKIYKMNECN